MKYFWLLGALLVLTLPTAWGQTSKGPRMVFKEKAKEFGEVRQGEKVTHTFVFTNTGNEPLVVSRVETTCGCTATRWTRVPVQPGQTGEIVATFDTAGKTGSQYKVISIYSNAPGGLETVALVGKVVLRSPAETE